MSIALDYRFELIHKQALMIGREDEMLPLLCVKYGSTSMPHFLVAGQLIVAWSGTRGLT
jgi:hypothetical protein